MHLWYSTVYSTKILVSNFRFLLLLHFLIHFKCLYIKTVWIRSVNFKIKTRSYSVKPSTFSQVLSRFNHLTNYFLLLLVIDHFSGGQIMHFLFNMDIPWRKHINTRRKVLSQCHWWNRMEIIQNKNMLKTVTISFFAKNNSYF